jgi:MFS family permease
MTAPPIRIASEPTAPASAVAANTGALRHGELPPLYQDNSFWGMAATQFLGAFNDNLFKQLVLLLSIAAVVKGAQASDRQGLAMFIFTVPFLAFTGYAGFLADRLPKRAIVVACKVAEIGVMALGAVAFAVYESSSSLWPLYVVLFLMGAHSAFFGPAKYGILPEMLRPSDLPRANGFLLMSTFLAIIFGTVIAGFLLRFFDDRLWVASVCCMSIAVAGLVTSLIVRRVPPANPQLKFELAAITVPHDMRELLRQDRPLLSALVVSSVFWLLAGMVPAAVNALGKIELQIGDAWTSVLTGGIGIGIAVGCVIGGLVSGGEVDFRLVRFGSLGMLVCLVLLAIPAHGDAAALIGADGELSHLPGISESAQWLGFKGSLPILLALGAFTGMFAVPLQVFMQCRPPDGKKGRMIAVMNQANWIGVLISAGLYQALAWLLETCHWPRSLMFFFIALLMLPVAILYHPKNERLSESPA